MSRVALVLAGGAARGAYEVGVVLHILEEVSRDLGREVTFDILCGTSVGAINVCFLAAFADEPKKRGERLLQHWTSLQLKNLLHPDGRALFDMARSLFGITPRTLPGDTRRGGILNPKGIEDVVRSGIPFHRIRDHLRAGILHAVTVSTTHVGTGRTVVFYDHEGEPARFTSADATMIGRRVPITADHALASAAIPFLFPAVRIEGEFYCDGGLRQNVPLSPARRMGADKLIVVSPRYINRMTPPVERRANEQDFPSPLFLLGKALNALLLDRVENDLDRLERINKLLEAGMRHYGPGFLDAINEELGHPATPTRPLQAVLVRASEDIGVMSSAWARTPRFTQRVPGLTGKVMRRLAESQWESDLLSYLLFDGEFAAQLIDLGRRDARARHAELCAIFDDKP